MEPLTIEQLIARLEADLAALKAIVAPPASAERACNSCGEGEEPTDRP